MIWELMKDLHADNPNKLPDDIPEPRFEVVAAPG